MIFKRPHYQSTNKLLSPKSLIIISSATLVIGAVIFAAAKLSSGASTTATPTQIQTPKAIKNINKEFSFPIKNDKGEEISKLKYILTDSQLTNEIIVKGQKASAAAGRTFLTVNLKIINDTNRKIQIDTRDYIRLIVNGNDKELLAPTIHNDPVEIQPISTTFTRLGFALNTTDKKQQLRVGEINGSKTTIDLNF